MKARPDALGESDASSLACLTRRLPSGEILRFGIVGIAATLVHFAVLRLGVEEAGLPPAPANGLAFSVAVGVSYFGQSFWVFRERSQSFVRLRKFLLSVVGGFLANIAIMALAVDVLGLHYLAGFVSALAIVPAATFVVNKFWVFRKESRG